MSKKSKTKIIFYVGHPAQYLFIRNILIQFKANNEVEYLLLLKTKDVLVNLVNEDSIAFVNIYENVRGKSNLGIIWSLLVRTIRVLKFSIKFKPNLFWGGDPSLSIVSSLLRKDCIIVGEDDYKIIYKLARITYPFATKILCPNVCDVGPYEHKKIGYNGYMKLAYLHPDNFDFNKDVSFKYTKSLKYAIIRLSELSAYHDQGIGGFNDKTIEDVIKKLEKNNYDVFISSEGKIPDKYSKYIIKPKPIDMAHILAGSSLFIGDSQSMTVEAAMLGIPSIRFSDFAGKISVLEELEHKYGLTFGINSKSSDKLLEKLNELLLINDLKKEFSKKWAIMINEKINVTNFIYNILINYPESIKIKK